ncbi:MAG TPA: Asd/ArgC dimerization domain-containing protein [Thermoanaerobaculia bacterium]|nr:Asd/ArgC dimerization domain-containing protein [Thermoanaerobaculia bacterium]
MIPKSTLGFRLAIVNPLNLVGEELRTILRERALPLMNIELLDATGTAGGALTEVNEEAAYVHEISEESLEDIDVAIFCGDPESVATWIARHEDDDFAAIDLTQPCSADQDGALLVADLNLGTLPHLPKLIVSPHPISIALALIIHTIEQIAPVELATVSVIEPASSHNQPGIDELLEQTLSVLNVRGIPKKVFDRQLAFNLYPPADSARVAEAVATQVRKLVRHDLAITVSITQGTIFHGHTFALFCRTSPSVTRDSILEALAGNNAITVADDEVSTVEAAGKDQILIGTVTADPQLPGGFWIWAACDNLRRGSALNAILILEEILARSKPMTN